MFPYTNNELSEKEIKKTILFIASKRIKYLGVNLTNRVKDMYTDNCKTLMKETEEDTIKWKDILCSWIGTINIVKISIVLKAISRFNAIPTEIPMAFSTETEQS